MINLLSGIICILLHWRKKLTLAIELIFLSYHFSTCSFKWFGNEIKIVFSATQDISGSVTKIKFCQKLVLQNLFLIEQLICGKICFQSDALFIAKDTVLMTVIADQENK